MLTYKLPGWLGIPIQSLCVISMIYLVQVTISGLSLWTSSPTLAVRMPEEAVCQCQSLLKQLQPLHKLSASLFQLGCSRPWILYICHYGTPGIILESSRVLFATDSRKDNSPQFFTSCPVLTGPRPTAWTIPLMFNLLKSLLLFRIPHETTLLLLCHMIDRAYSLTVSWNMHPPKNPQHLGKPEFSFWWLVGT